jgi:uncharacterized protein YjbI with pentapeptide repeats
VKRPDHEAADQPYPVLSNRTITWAAVALILFGGGLATILLITFGDGRHDAQLEAIKTAGTIVLGTGGAAALWLTARRQRTSEIALIQKHLDQLAIDRAHKLQEEVARTTNADAESRRITELYGRAVDQLGSDKAPVRLGGLYALRRLAQDNPEQRQTIVDVLCAYLRMPHEPAEGTQEEQVRLAAERVLAKHLRPGNDATFWSGIEIDLNHATLTNFDLSHCRFGHADFTGTRFIGTSNFGHAEFTGPVSFRESLFRGSVDFEEATFGDTAHFTAATFSGFANFRKSCFANILGFIRATMSGDTYFSGCIFHERVAFTGSDFIKAATFTGSEFMHEADFGGTNFRQGAGFLSAKFANISWFFRAKFHGPTFILDGSFENFPFNTTDPDGPLKEKTVWCWVRIDLGESKRHVWPRNWVVEPSPDRPDGVTEGRWGRLLPRDESLRASLLDG